MKIHEMNDESLQFPFDHHRNCNELCWSIRDHLRTLPAISRCNYFHIVGGWFRAPFILKIVLFTSIWKPRLKSQYIPFVYKGWVDVFFLYKVIRFKNRMQTYEMIPYWMDNMYTYM